MPKVLTRDVTPEVSSSAALSLFARPGDGRIQTRRVAILVADGCKGKGLVALAGVFTLTGGGWTVRVYHKPLINWIWGGALLMAIGGGFAVTDKRYAIASKKAASETPPGKPEPVSKVATTAASTAVE
jgi:hypothetical protein